jgi:hypothetical protein
MQTILGTATGDARTKVTTIVHWQGQTLEMQWPNDPFKRVAPISILSGVRSPQGMDDRFRF